MKKLSPWHLMNAAENHGTESDPGHEVGDLQDVVLACFEVLTKEQKQKVFAHDSMVELRNEWAEV